ncbi:DUF4352 domain-containing protein [Candidatus Saccharibacteria bacterium]|nr:DUF4352 domain-containing protein [Candidatus Saccharibacteria bacterium]MBH1972452.1 DUF4352 domain-containing protein [Candidatus Saccharibacteria bacterium]MBH1990206.1 DUF4352 domain-containing protein [Candidatus Saccharibacteria bacterium]
MNTKQSKPWYKRFWVWALIIVVLIGIGGATGGNKSDTPTNTASSGTVSESKTTDSKTEFKVGETATFDDKSITIKDVQRNYSTSNQFAQPESGKEFVLVTVEIANNSKSSMDFNTFEFKLQDSNGVQLNESFTALSEGKLNSGSLAPGGKVTGKLAYEVPKDDTGLKLLYQSFSFFSNKAVTFNLI